MSVNKNSPESKASPAQKAFWQAITVGDYGTVRCLLEHKNINVNMYDTAGEQRQGCTALHLAILEMPTWKGSEGRNGIQTAQFVEKFLTLLLDHGADFEMVCGYGGDWYLQTTAGKTKSFFPDGYDAIGLVLQFIEITRGADVIACDVTRRLELIRDLILRYMAAYASPNPVKTDTKDSLGQGCYKKLLDGTFTDVELVCDDGSRFKAHKMVLAARSDVFNAMFTVPLAESQNKEVAIREVDSTAFKVFLHSLYTDEIKESDMELTPELLCLANRYNVPALKKRCTSALTGNLSIQNAVNVLSIADASEAQELKSSVLRFITENIAHIVKTPDFEALAKPLMLEVIQHMTTSSPRQKRKSTTSILTSRAKVRKYTASTLED